MVFTSCFAGHESVNIVQHIVERSHTFYRWVEEEDRMNSVFTEHVDAWFARLGSRHYGSAKLSVLSFTRMLY